MDYTFYSQIGQDKFVFNTIKEYLNPEKEGTFLDIGCFDYKHINNTYFLEKELNWRGVGIDIEDKHREGWEINRPNSIFVLDDATTIDYAELLKVNNMPKVIDYLSLDLEPPHLTLKALEKLFETDYIFNIVTYETDFYRIIDNGPTSLRVLSQELFKSKGYILVQEGIQDDFYIHNSLVSQ